MKHFKSVEEKYAEYNDKINVNFDFKNREKGETENRKCR